MRRDASSGWTFIKSPLVVVSRRLARIHPIINRAPGTMTTAPRRRLASLLLLLFLSSSSLAAADDDDERGEPFNGAVHGDDGADDLDEGRFEPAHGSPTDWRDLELAPKFTSVASWQRPQFRVDEGGDYVRMRGWIASTSRAGAGEPVFALPEDAAPGRTERWRVTMKGADRALSVGEDGVAVLDEEMRRNPPAAVQRGRPGDRVKLLRFVGAGRHASIEHMVAPGCSNLCDGAANRAATHARRTHR